MCSFTTTESDFMRRTSWVLMFFFFLFSVQVHRWETCSWSTEANRWTWTQHLCPTTESRLNLWSRWWQRFMGADRHLHLQKHQNHLDNQLYLYASDAIRECGKARDAFSHNKAIFNVTLWIITSLVLVSLQNNFIYLHHICIKFVYLLFLMVVVYVISNLLNSDTFLHSFYKFLWFDRTGQL